MLKYEVTNGVSDTWGSFGAGELVTSVPTTLANLDGYDVKTFFGAKNVSSLVLKQVRLVTATGEVWIVDHNEDLLVAAAAAEN